MIHYDSESENFGLYELNVSTYENHWLLSNK